MTAAPALEARDVSARLGTTAVLHDISLAFGPGTWTCIVGPNGAGKSTLLRALAGLVPHEGEVFLHGRSRQAWPHRERARRLAWLGQNEGTADDLTVQDVVLLGRLPHRAWLAAPTPADLRAVDEALAATQSSEWRDRSLGHLSAGERQRVLLARALAVQADVLLMDEPLANLDPPHQADWIALARAQAAAGHTVVSVLHELPAALQAHALVVMANGCVVHHGPTQDAASHRAIEAVFDHRVAVHGVAGQWVTLPR